MSSPPSSDITTVVKDAVDIVELIGEHVTLARRGRSFKGLCPFHDDHNPSFDVDPEKQRYRCWSCGETGDAYDFVMRRERVDFREALELLAQRAQIPLPARTQPRGESSKQGLLEVLNWAAQQFQDCLGAAVGGPAREYLEQRGVSAASVREFRLGFAPQEWSWLLERAERKGISPRELERCGLVRPRSRGPGFLDMFRGRVIFPIRGLRGQIIAFGGRILPRFDSGETPKYLNSPETPVFNKRQNLYGLDAARESLVRSKTAVVVEGYTDCIMAHQHGFHHVVGTLGTALGEDHVRMLRRFSERIILVFDGDDAGQRSADRALELFLNQEVDLRVLTLPGGLDPFDFLRQHGADGFQNALEGAVDALEFKLQRADRLFDTSTTAGLRQSLDFVLGAVAALPMLPSGNMGVTRDIMLDRLAQRHGVSGESVRRRLREMTQRQNPRKPGENRAQEGGNETQNPGEDATERELLEVLLAHPPCLAEVVGQLEVAEVTSPGLKRIYEACVAIHKEGHPLTLDGLRLRLNDRTLSGRASALAELGGEKGAFERRLSEVLLRFQRRRTTGEETEIRRRWSAAGDDEAAVRGLLERKYELAKARHT